MVTAPLVSSTVPVATSPAGPDQTLTVQTFVPLSKVVSTPHLHDVRKPEDIEAAFGAIVAQRNEALLAGLDSVVIANRARVVELAAQHRLPAIYASREFVEDGGLLSYGTHYGDLYRRAAIYVDKIFKGAKPADLPVEQPTKLEIVINLKSAKTLGLTMPPSLLARADDVIE